MANEQERAGSTDNTVTLERIVAAREAISGLVRVTPMWPSISLTAQLGVPVSFKCEQMQLAGSFKIRGATNFVHQLDAAGIARGLVGASAGNHAQGIALAGSRRGISVVVVMPETAPLAKITACREYGARVVLAGTSLEEARAESMAIAAREGRIYVPPFDDDAVIAGQGTVGLEILEQCPEVAEVLVPAGGGGLLGGIACAIKTTRPNVRITGVQAAAMDGICRSVAGHQRTSTPAARTIADGVAVAGPSDRTFDLIERFVDGMVSVHDDAIAHAIVTLIERSKMIVEGAGAVAVAALQSGAYIPAGPTVVVLSGGNIDINLLGSIVRRGLADAGRYQHLSVEVSDTPGELALVSSAIAAAGGNILEVDHNREAPGMPIGVAVLDLLLEVNGKPHFDEIVQSLRDRGMRGFPGIDARLATSDAQRRHDLA